MNYDPILIVEDSDEDFDTVCEAALKAGVANPLVRAKDAYEAEELLGLSGKAPKEKFKMVILDYNLPGKSGVELLQDFAQSEQRSKVPVVFFTTSSTLEDCKDCYRAGANAYHTKSLRYDECIHTLHCIFEYWLKRAMLPSAPNT